MTGRSARFALPFILPGQAQKEQFHNEALAALDGLLHAAVEGVAATGAGGRGRNGTMPWHASLRAAGDSWRPSAG